MASIAAANCRPPLNPSVRIAEAAAFAAKDGVAPLARIANLPKTALADDENRRATPDGRFVIVEMICTRIGCVPLRLLWVPV